MTSPPGAGTPESGEGRSRTVRHRVWELLDFHDSSDRLGWWLDVLILSLIGLNTVALILESVPAVSNVAGTFFDWFEIFSVAVFTVEYVSRLWASVESPKTVGAFSGRLRYALRPMMIVDLMAILPAYLPFLGLDFRFVRALRLMRIFRVLKIARYSSALQLLGRVFVERRADLMLIGFAIGIVMVLASSLLYFVERGADPATFDSIPEAMWWAVVTLTTVGYGDLYPVTAFGRVLGGVVALVGVCVIAIPTGIIGAGFSDALRAQSDQAVCPACGRPHDPETNLPATVEHERGAKSTPPPAGTE